MKDRHNTVGTKYYVSRFKADINNLKRTIDDALAYYDRSFGFMDEDTRFELKIVLNELLINAIKHGGKAGANRDGNTGADQGDKADTAHDGNADEICYVKIIAGMAADDCALLIIEDDGDGYDTTMLNKRRSTGGIEETGRGIFLVKNLCEDFMVNEKGNKVVINKKLRKAYNVGV